MTPIITRFAPSPTGNLHIGSARTALINFIVNQQNPLSKFYIRIEDTDKERSRSEFSQNILKGLEWLGLNWENEIQIQSQRIKRHQEIANKLLENTRKCRSIK
jgi:glutamyl-tRNA synthetase